MNIQKTLAGVVAMVAILQQSIASAATVEDRLAEDRARRVSGAQEQDVADAVAHGAQQQLVLRAAGAGIAGAQQLSFDALADTAESWGLSP